MQKKETAFFKNYPWADEENAEKHGSSYLKSFITKQIKIKMSENLPPIIENVTNDLNHANMKLEEVFRYSAFSWYSVPGTPPVPFFVVKFLSKNAPCQKRYRVKKHQQRHRGVAPF